MENLEDQRDVVTHNIWEVEWQKNLVDMAMQRIKKRVHPKQFQLFDMYVVKEWSVKDIQKAVKVSRTQVYLAKLRISRLIRKEVARLERES